MSKNYWYQRSAVVIQDALTEAKQRGLDDKETWKLVDSRYPFGERTHWPYKQWLKARKEAKGGQRWKIIEPTQRQKICWYPSCSQEENLTEQAGRFACPRHQE